MKKVLAFSAVVLMVGTGAAFAATPYPLTSYGAQITAGDHAKAQASDPGTVFSTVTSDGFGRTTTKTFKVNADGSPKLIDVDYQNFN